MRKASTIIIVTVLVISGLIFWFSDSTNLPSDTMEGDYLQEIDQRVNLKDLQGNNFALSSLSGKNIIVNSWASWCPFCVEELKDFAKVQEQFNENLKIVAVNRAEPRKKVNGFIGDLGVKKDLVFLLDENDKFYQSIGGFTMPETIFVNKNGEVIFHKRGPMDAVEIKSKISEKFNLDQ